MRPHLAFAGLLLSLFIFSGCSADDAAAPAPGTSPPAKTAIQSSGGDSCKAYVAAVRNVCLDGITRDLGMPCNNQMIAVEIVQSQAAGTLFDVGSGSTNAKVVESVCASYLKSLQKKRQSKDASMAAKGSAGPKCTAFAENFDTKCLATLGQQPLPDTCKSATRMLVAGARLPAEDRCAMAEQQMK